MRVLIWIILIAIIASPVIYLNVHEDAVEVTVIAVTKGHVEQTVTALAAGTVVPTEDSMIASGVMGIVMDVPVEEGERVEKGDLLILLDHIELDARVTLAEANVSAGESRLQQARLAAEIYADVATTRLKQSEAQLDMAQLDFNRIKKLSDEKAVSQRDLDRVALSLRVAQESVAAARAGVRENLVRAEEILTAKSTVKQLGAALAVARAAREKAFVRAPFHGVVARILFDVGEAVTMGMPLLQLVQDSTAYVQAPFDEANAAEISVGQKARINLDVYRDRDFQGKVVYISPVVSINPDLSRTLDVKIRVLEERERFMAGMSADVTILVDEKDDVIFVPSESLIRERFAYVVEKGRAVRREVEPGLGNWNTREIIRGLNLNDVLITSVSARGLADGVKVRIVDELGG